MKELGKHLKQLRKERFISQKELGDILGVSQTAIANYETGKRFPSQDILRLIARYFNCSIDYLLGTNNIFNQQGIDKSIEDYKEIQQTFEQYLLYEKEDEAYDLIFSYRYNSEQLIELYEKVMRTTLINVGIHWEKGLINVAKEHYISNVVMRIITSLPIINSINQKNESTNKQVVICMVLSSEFHTIGMRMIADYFNILGYKTYYIGNDTPTESLIQMITQTKANVLALSITMEYHLDAAKNLIHVLKYNNNIKNIKIIVGGQAFHMDKNEYRKIGADAYANDYDSLKKALKD